MNNTEERYVRMALDAWSREINATDALLEKLSDDQLMREIAPGRNRGIYLVGHLTAEHDQMLPLLRFKEALFPELKVAFIDAPDRSVAALPAVAQLRDQWRAVSDALTTHIVALPVPEWFTRHANIAEADFPQEPHRNRLNVLLSRTVHLAHHRGQMVLLRGS